MTDSPSPALWKLAETADKVRLLQEIDRLSEQVDYWRKKAQSLERYRKSPVKGADETTWSCDGLRGYVYGFFTDDIALFRFRGTRRKFVPKFVDLLRKASEHSGIRAFEHSSIYSLRCSQAQMPKCCSRALNAAKRC